MANIQFMTIGAHGASKWIDYKVDGRIAKQLEFADEITIVHKHDNHEICTKFRKV